MKNLKIGILKKMDNKRIDFKNRKFDYVEKKILELASFILSSKECYYYNKDWILKYKKNDRN